MEGIGEWLQMHELVLVDTVEEASPKEELVVLVEDYTVVVDCLQPQWQGLEGKRNLLWLVAVLMTIVEDPVTVHRQRHLERSVLEEVVDISA